MEMSLLVVEILKTAGKCPEKPLKRYIALSKGFKKMTSRGLFQCKLFYNSVVGSGIQDYVFRMVYRIMHFWWAKARAVGKSKETEQKMWQRQGRGTASTVWSSTALLAAWLMALWASASTHVRLKLSTNMSLKHRCHKNLPSVSFLWCLIRCY